MNIAELLGPDGPFAEALPNFRPRAGQQELAAAVVDSFERQGTLVAEAATGTGKTLAYLAPALSSGLKVLISTGTRNLQDQLFHRDLPMAMKALGRKPPSALLKGRANYLCLYRMELARAQGRFNERNVTEQLIQVFEWSQATRQGELSELSVLPDDAPIWPHVTSTIDNCLGSECPRYNDCYLIKARRKAIEADVVVVNHHLLFADMALKEHGYGEILPAVEAFIIDEAHQVPDTATRFFSRGLSSRQLRELVRDAMQGAGQVSGAMGLLREPLATMEQTTKELVLSFSPLPERGHGDQLARHTELSGLMLDLAEDLSALHTALEPLAEADRGLGNVTQRAERLRDVVKAYLADDHEGVRWFESRRKGFAIHLTPLDVAGPLARFRATRPAAWVFTSATLSVGGRFHHFVERLGLDDARTVQIQSPFNHRQNGLCWLPPNLPAPGDFGHTQALLKAVWPLLQASQGRAFLLFTTHRALRQAADWLRQHASFPLFIQGEAPRTLLVDAFRAAGNGILLGAASFWEGVDVPGPALSVVVIDKLPFAAPGDPVLQARLDNIRQQGGNPFKDVQLPEAVLSLKQGAGRLIRAHDDRGVVVLGDPRLVQKHYGRLFLNSLPPWPLTDKVGQAIEFITNQNAETQHSSGD